MAAPKGNQFWKLADNAGRPRSYMPDTLWQVAQDYFEWCEENPWNKMEAIKGGDNAGMLIAVPTSRPFTLSGLCVFAGIAVNTFDVYSNTQEYKEVTTRIREICYTQKFEGAAVGAFNANIIARDLGLKDSQDFSSDGKPIQGFIVNVKPFQE
jgi:hypothetical protein